MDVVEFVTQLTGGTALPIPGEAAARLPKSGPARVIVLTGNSPDENEWQMGTYEQFLREDPPEDAIYESLR